MLNQHRLAGTAGNVMPKSARSDGRHIACPAPRGSLVHGESPGPSYRLGYAVGSGRSAELVGVAQPIARGSEERGLRGQLAMG